MRFRACDTVLPNGKIYSKSQYIHVIIFLNVSKTVCKLSTVYTFLA